MFSFQLLLKVIYTRPNTDTNWYFCNTEQLTNPWMILGFDSITTYEEFIKQLEDPSNQEFLDAMDEYNKNHNITVELEEFLLDND